VAGTVGRALAVAGVATGAGRAVPDGAVPVDAGAGRGALAPVVAAGAAGGVTGAGGRVAAGGAPFSMRVRSLALLCGDAVWRADKTDRIRTLDMAATIAPQPMNGKLCSV
jgi:hypothetical protein